MAVTTTKYSVGDKLYLVDSRGLSNEYIRVIREEVKSIQLGQYGNVRYEFRILARDEREVYDDLNTAKAAAKKQAKERYEKNLETIESENLKPVEVNND